MKKFLLAFGLVIALSGCWGTTEPATLSSTPEQNTPATPTTVLRGGELLDTIREQEQNPEVEPFARLMLSEVSNTAETVAVDVWL